MWRIVNYEYAVKDPGDACLDFDADGYDSYGDEVDWYNDFDD